jgi:hypothetical protein
VELLKNLDKFLADEMFCSFGGNLSINLGQGFGAVKGHAFIKKLRDAYNEESFYLKDGSLNLKPCVDYQNPIFKDYGFELWDKYQCINNIAIYPSEVFSPLGMVGRRNNFTDNTASIHHVELSWIPADEREKRSVYTGLMR